MITYAVFGKFDCGVKQWPHSRLQLPFRQLQGKETKGQKAEEETISRLEER